MGAADRDTIRPYLNPQNAFAAQLALDTEQRAQIVAENAEWVDQGHTLSLVGSYYDATYFNNGIWNNNVPTANDWAHMGAANRDIIRALLTMPEALAIRDQVTQEQWLTIVEENTLWAQQGHTLHAVGSAIPTPTQFPTGLHVDHVNLNTDHTYQIDSGIRPTNCDWA
jgi:ribosomal protein S16